MSLLKSCRSQGWEFRQVFRLSWKIVVNQAHVEWLLKSEMDSKHAVWHSSAPDEQSVPLRVRGDWKSFSLTLPPPLSPFTPTTFGTIFFLLSCLYFTLPYFFLKLFFPASFPASSFPFSAFFFFIYNFFPILTFLFGSISLSFYIKLYHLSEKQYTILQLTAATNNTVPIFFHPFCLLPSCLHVMAYILLVCVSKFKLMLRFSENYNMQFKKHK